MNFNQYTQKSIEAVQSAQSIAQSMGHQQLTQDHLLKALISQNDGLIPQLITNAGADISALSRRLDDEIARMPQVSGGNQQMYLSPDLEKALADAEKEAHSFQDEYISVEHLMLGLFDGSLRRHKRNAEKLRDHKTGFSHRFKGGSRQSARHQ